MTSLTPDQLLVIIIGFVSLIPTIVLFRQYLKTAIVDFLLFSGVFLSVTVAVFSQILADGTNILLFFQLHRWSLCCTFLFFFLHGSRILWTRTPSVIWYIGIIWFAILTFLIFFWEIMPQEESAFVLFMEMPVIQATYHPKGAGFETSGGVVIYSSGYFFLSTLFLIYASGILLYAYITIEPPQPSRNIVIAKRMWLIVWSIIFLYSILELPWIFNFFNSLLPTNINLNNIIVLVAETVSACIAIFIPESMLISHAQILRAVNLYKKIIVLSPEQATKRFGSPSLVEYLQKIPPEIFSGA